MHKVTQTITKNQVAQISQEDCFLRKQLRMSKVVHAWTNFTEGLTRANIDASQP